MDDERALSYLEFELEFLTLVIMIFTNSDQKNFSPFAQDEMSPEQKVGINNYIAELFMKHVKTDSFEDSIRFFSFLLLKAASYYYSLVPSDETILEHALTESLGFSTHISDATLRGELLERIKRLAGDEKA